MTAKVITWNANGLIPKITELRTYIQTQDIDIAQINETKMTVKDKLRIKDYTILRTDRNARGGSPYYQKQHSLQGKNIRQYFNRSPLYKTPKQCSYNWCVQ